MIPGFSLDGIHTSEFGLYARLVNMPLVPKKRIYQEYAVGVAGSLIFEDEYEDSELVYECRLLSHDYKIKRVVARKIAQWLISGTKLIKDSEPYIYHDVKLYTKIDNEIIASSDRFEVKFLARPVAYSTFDNDDLTGLRSDFVLDIEMSKYMRNSFSIVGSTTLNISNLGNYHVYPIVEIDGVADSIIIGTTKNLFSVTDIITKTYIDCKNMLCYTKSGDIKINKLKDFEGTFIRLESGINNITVDGQSMNVNVKFNFRNAYI